MPWYAWLILLAVLGGLTAAAIVYRNRRAAAAAALAKGKSIQAEVTRLALSPDEVITRSGV